MAQKGVTIDLKESRKSVEQALRELKILMDDDIQRLKDNRYRVKPAEKRRLRKKMRAANIRKYNKYN